MLAVRAKSHQQIKCRNMKPALPLLRAHAPDHICTSGSDGLGEINGGSQREAQHTQASVESSSAASKLAQARPIEQSAGLATRAQAERLPYDKHFSSANAAGLLPLADPLNGAETAKWFFATHLDEFQQHLFKAARAYWVDDLWEAAKANVLVLRLVSLSTMVKKGVLCRSYDATSVTAQKTALMQDLRSVLSQTQLRPVDPHLMLIIAMLAELESRESIDVPNARIHVQALRRLSSSDQLHGLEWRFAVRVDLRQSLWTGKYPILPFYIPSEFDKQLPADVSTRQKELCAQLARSNVENTPRSPVIRPEKLLHLLEGLHLMSMCWESTLASADPPFAQIYRMAYHVRVLTADNNAKQRDFGKDRPVELTLISIQLHIWISSRFWVPQSRSVHLSVLRRASVLLDDDLLEVWRERASMTSLLWVLMTLNTARIDMGNCSNPALDTLLTQVCRSLHVESHADLEYVLKWWPWISDWHPPRVELVWNRLGIDAAFCLSDAALLLDRRSKERKPWFVGGLEFYCSL